MPTLRNDAYYGAHMEQARIQLEQNKYSFDDKDGREFEQGREVSRYVNPSDYDASYYSSRDKIFEDIFSRAIKSRAARLHNIANR